MALFNVPLGYGLFSQIPTNEKLEEFDNRIRRYITKPSQITIFIEQFILKPYQFYLTAGALGKSWIEEYYKINASKVQFGKWTMLL